MTSRSLGHRAPLLWIVLPMIAGLVLGRLGLAVPMGGLLTLAITMVGLAWWAIERRPRIVLATLVMGAVCAGNASYTLQRARLTTWDTLPPREAQVDVRITRLFEQPDLKRVNGLATIVRAPAHLKPLERQRVYFSLHLRSGERAPIRGSVVTAMGVLVAVPNDAPNDSFDGYLANSGTNFRLTRGRIVALQKPASRFLLFCHQAAGRFSILLSQGVAEKRPELVAVLRAMLLGQKHELSDEHSSLFMRSGTMHLFAISGLHIGIIALGLHALLAVLRLPRLVRFATGTLALWLYVEITGGTPSAVRAFIMVVVVEASLMLRAPSNPVAALANSALIVVLIWPLQVFSASFQMSYGIVAALLLLGLPLADALRERTAGFRLLPQPAWRWYHHWSDALHRKATAAIALGLASTLVSTLASVLYFKLFTPAAFFTNLLLIPAAGLVILSGFASLVVGLLGLTDLGSLFNHAGVLVLAIIEHCVRLVVAIPGAWQPAQFTAHWIGPTSCLALAAAMGFGYSSRWANNRGGWWPPFAIVGLVLLTGVEYGGSSE